MSAACMEPQLTGALQSDALLDSRLLTWALFTSSGHGQLPVLVVVPPARPGYAATVAGPHRLYVLADPLSR